MAILPVSGIRVNNNSKVTSFKGLDFSENEEIQKPRKSNKLASVPVALLIAMSPAMMNGKEPIKAIPIDTENQTEILAYTQPSELEESELQARPASTNAPFGFKMLGNKKIFKTLNATVKGEPATLIFAGVPTIDGRANENGVQYIYCIPKDNDYPKNARDLPQVKSIIYHSIGANEFCGLEMEIPVFQNERLAGYIYRELKIDDDTANYLADFIMKNTPYKDIMVPKLRLQKTNSPELLKIRSVKY